MSNWQTVKLGDCAEIARGSSPRPINDSAYFDNGTIPWIKIADATASFKYIYKTKEYVNEYGASFSRKLPPGSLIVAASGTLGFAIFLGVEGCVHDGWMYFKKIDEKRLDKQFLYYLLNTLTKSFNAFSYGAAIQNINTDILRNTAFRIPTVNVQRNIAAILSAYDELIEHNQLRIALLEKMAEEIYREWFVRLRFPGHENVKIVKGMPAGWRTVPFTEICEFQKGKTPDQIFPEKNEGLLPYVSVEFLEGVDTGHVQKKRNSIVCENGDVLMLMDGARSGLVFRGKKGVVGSTFARVAVEPLYRDVVYEFLRATREHIVSNNTGSAIPHANKEFIHRLMMYLPQNEKLIEQFNAVYRSLFEQTLNLMSQNELLRRSRDALLPRLISGKFSVENLDIQFPPSMAEDAHA